MLDHIGQVERHTKCNNFIREPAVCNAHLASTAAEHQYNFHTYLGSACMPAYVARLQIRAHFLVAVRQAAFYCYNAKLDAPSLYGLLVVPIHSTQFERLQVRAIPTRSVRGVNYVRSIVIMKQELCQCDSNRPNLWPHV